MQQCSQSFKKYLIDLLCWLVRSELSISHYFIPETRTAEWKQVGRAGPKIGYVMATVFWKIKVIKNEVFIYCQNKFNLLTIIDI